MAAPIYLRAVTTLELDEEKCTGCGVCLDVCPRAVLAQQGKKIHIVNRDACMECGACARNCEAGAIRARAGVGCAQAVFNTALLRTNRSCCYIEPDDDDRC